MQLQSKIFSNGLCFVHAQVASPVSYCGFTINAGTRDENENEQGIAHFVEHLLFKGTAKRRAFHILNRMDNVGGELNAFTTKEETVIYSVFMNEHFVRAVDLLTDLVFNSTIPENEFSKEREVILDEIRSYQDSPAEQIFDDFENMLFKGHSLGHPILGTEASLQSLSPTSCRDFIKTHYFPDRMVFFYLGKTPFNLVLKTIERLFSKIDFPKNTGIPSSRTSPVSYVPTKEKSNMETYQSHVIMGCPAYSLFDPKRRAFHLLNNHLGGPCMNSLLNISLREKRGLVYNIESSFTPFTDTGIFSVYFGADPKYLKQCTRLISKELQKLRSQRLSELKLHAIKKQLMGQISIASDNHENLALSIGKSYLRRGGFESLEERYRSIAKISAADLLDAANEMLDENRLSLLIFE